ncbi:MAG: EAL domain-containing protein, partial [Gammaproteobacteria bacterium]
MFDSHDNPAPVQRFFELLGKSLSDAARSSESVGLIIVHLEDLNRLMSTYGFRTGNQIAVEIAERLNSGLRDKDRIMRISESKFAIVINALRNRGILLLAASKLSGICSAPIQVANEKMSLRIRMGLALGPSAAPDPETLHHNAEIALLSAQTDEADFAVFTPAQRDRASDSLQLENELDQAIESKAFEVHYQPKVAAADFSPCGAEALIRWNNQKRGPVSPDIFIPLADRPGRMEPLTSFVLSTAIRHALDWPTPLPVSINVSAGMLIDT